MIQSKFTDCISFHTTRYFGKNTDEVREKRIIIIPPDQLIKNGLTLPHGRSSRESSCEAASSNEEADISLTDAETMSDESSSSSDGRRSVEEGMPSIRIKSVTAEPQIVSEIVLGEIESL